MSTNTAVALVALITLVQAAERAGDRVRMILIPGVGHFEIASPRAGIWPKVESAIRSLIDGKLPPL